jgi:hypothetical protein
MADFALVGGPGGDFVWLGLTDVAQEGDYRWITNEAFSYSNWGPPEPNNLLDEDYGLLWRRDFGNGVPLWSWNDSDPVPANANDHRVGYIVEYDNPIAPVPEPSSVLIWSILGMAVFSATRLRAMKSRR